MADDYFSAMQKVEQRLALDMPKEVDIEVVKVQLVFQLIQQLETPELELEERLDIASQLRCAMNNIHQHASPL